MYGNEVIVDHGGLCRVEERLVECLKRNEPSVVSSLTSEVGIKRAYSLQTLGTRFAPLVQNTGRSQSGICEQAC